MTERGCRRNGFHILRNPVNGIAHTFHRFSSPNHNRFAGLWFGFRLRAGFAAGGTGLRLLCMASLHCFRQACNRSRRAAIYGGRDFRRCLRKGFACGQRKILRRCAPLNDKSGGVPVSCHSERSEEASRPQTRSPVLASPCGGGVTEGDREEMRQGLYCTASCVPYSSPNFPAFLQHRNSSRPVETRAPIT